MIDPRREAVLTRARNTGQLTDRTCAVDWYKHQQDGKIGVQFSDGKHFAYGATNVRILHSPERRAITANDGVEVCGEAWESATEVLTFADAEGGWCHVFYRRADGEACSAHPASHVRVLDCALPSASAEQVWNYWNAIVSLLPAEDLLRRPFGQVRTDPRSALHAYLSGAPVLAQELDQAPIFPFRCNLSQRAAVKNALTRSVSVIEGPPGTGKTETILNIIANVIDRDGTVGVVSHSNSAVDNVREKLDELGFGHVVAHLGKQDNQKAFFDAQPAREEKVTAFVDAAAPAPDPNELRSLDERLHRLQAIELRRAERRNEAAAHRLELQHFEQHVQAHVDEMPDLERLPLLRRSSERLLDYLAESELERRGTRPGVLRRIRKYFKYGSLRGLDPEDTAVVLRLQRAYYDKRIAELDRDVEQLDEQLHRANFDDLARRHKDLSAQKLRADLADRYRALPKNRYDKATYRRGATFRAFLRDYPVLLSTCHSLRESVAGEPLDYLIIDEASQVDPIVAGLAMACCTKLVVVGDTRQLSPIPPSSAKDVAAPSSAYDCSEHSILTSLRAVHGDALPSTLLREHYRCHPAIIGFCNKEFYRDGLIPFRTGGDERPMLVRPTAEGNHMRRYRHGRANRREIDVIEAEVIPEHCGGVADEDIGITTPFRLQADTAQDVLDNLHADTVHRFQGRQKKVVILSTVLDETKQGQSALSFADAAPLVNVAVSRAIDRFVVVTNNDMLPRSRHIRDLIGHIDYQIPGESIVDSSVVSIFDLLYQKFSDRLSSLRRRLKNEMHYRSEDITWTVLSDLLHEEQHAHLTVVTHVLLAALFPDRSALTEAQAGFVGRGSSVDFMVYNRVTNRPLLGIEVDGDKYHANDPVQLRRDRLKDAIFAAHDVPLLRLPTTGSGEQQRIRDALDDAEDRSARTPLR